MIDAAFSVGKSNTQSLSTFTEISELLVEGRIRVFTPLRHGRQFQLACSSSGAGSGHLVGVAGLCILH
jgi:hypothetical protein